MTVQRRERRCRCGGWLIIYEDPDVEGFRSIHSVPECEPYKAMCAKPGVRCDGLVVEFVSPEKPHDA